MRCAIVFLVLVPLFSIIARAQSIISIRCLDSSHYIENLESIKSIYTLNKSIDSSIELSFYTAISNLNQDLSNARIEVKYCSIGTSLNARPTIVSLLFKRKEKRKYVIRINNKRKSDIPLFEDASFNAQVGVLGHELCHIIDYSNRKFGGILKRMFDYSTKERKSIYEKEIDSMTICSGLGWPLYDWEMFVQNSPVATPEYKEFKREIYYTPQEIAIKIEEFDSGVNP